ncbi:MAG TPA: GAF and ANTAR domain-containing protein [Acidimicrobiales bacterium]|nr:GAF and ANTAR domain-containing protein [Acidimicrobiales bacterium]
MSAERRTRILTKLTGDVAPEGETKRLCEVCAEVTGMSGAGIMLMSGDVPRGSVCTTDEASAVIEELQFGLGEGPCVDAYHQDRAVLEPDLAHPRTPRWLAFSPSALQAGVGAIFGFPLRVGAVRLGALNLYRVRPGSLTAEQHPDALVMADITAHAVLVMQAGAPPGRLSAELEAGGEFHYPVHQASGMIAAQLDVGVAQALIRLRAYAFGHDRAVAEVAGDVVGRRLRFDNRSGQKDPPP